MMNLRSVTALPVLCAAFFLLSGCAGRYAPATLAADSSVPLAPAFADQVAALPDGSTQYFAESPFGPATVTGGRSYLSGLGNECRSAHVNGNTGRYRFAVCREQNGAWRFIPTIFESMPQ